MNRDPQKLRAGYRMLAVVVAVIAVACLWATSLNPMFHFWR